LSRSGAAAGRDPSVVPAAFRGPDQIVTSDNRRYQTYRSRDAKEVRTVVISPRAVDAGTSIQRTGFVISHGVTIAAQTSSLLVARGFLAGWTRQQLLNSQKTRVTSVVREATRTSSCEDGRSPPTQAARRPNHVKLFRALLRIGPTLSVSSIASAAYHRFPQIRSPLFRPFPSLSFIGKVKLLQLLAIPRYNNSHIGFPTESARRPQG
jgi:hypothetical protein